ncbi:hypothetical protein Tco_1005202 [Tanacetum coccineum]|uniref:Uncharacterized protein n=1 Tax=Tanacetum coccineum TaxID=301880 RepID=A0ABQ5FF95_9ASTR
MWRDPYASKPQTTCVPQPVSHIFICCSRCLNIAAADALHVDQSPSGVKLQPTPSLSLSFFLVWISSQTWFEQSALLNYTKNAPKIFQVYSH